MLHGKRQRLLNNQLFAGLYECLVVIGISHCGFLCSDLCLNIIKRLVVFMNYNLQRKLLIFGFLFFPVLLMLLFLVIPSFRMVFYSFTNWDGVLPAYNFIGLENYKRVFTEETLWLSFKNNGVYALTGIFVNAVALFFAVLLDQKMKAANFYKTVIFLPFVLNVTAIAYMFNYMYDYREGPINMLVRYLGFQPIKFFGEGLVIFSLVSMSNWRWLGYTMVIYIAALQSIELEIYESASIDGANGWQTFLHITFPSIKRIVQLLLFLSLSGSLQAFTESLVLTHGGPGKASYTFMFYIIDTYTRFNDYGYAAAMSVVLVVVILALAGLQRKMVKGGVY